ncbi:MaoC/PaaZ C-terminal domain-containing protein [Umezawaea sp. NPDC059074]|uniref:MaoC/PaaZ C-terminal domain-containing protein n=1 Tax=Umezawaea sp. NPDC059074 TaxID=3346716 RepID=UPI0036953888
MSTVVRSWTEDDVERYAAAVGGTGMQPGFAIAVAQFGGPQVEMDADMTQVLHAEQSLTLSGELPLSGTVEVTRHVTDVFDKGSGALIVREWRATGDAEFSTRASLFVRGAGGFGGPRGTTTRLPMPDRAPDVELGFRTSADQADRYRLTGDDNPLHWDPVFAERGGFPRPILHGLATYGITARLLADELDVLAVGCRFAAPVFPGDELLVSAWRVGDEVRFRTAVNHTTVIDDGRATPRS